MNTREIFDALGLSDHNSGVFAGEWLEATGDTIDVTNPTTVERKEAETAKQFLDGMDNQFGLGTIARCSDDLDPIPPILVTRPAGRDKLAVGNQ